MAGLLHDLGKLLLLRLQPFALQATLCHARENRVPLAEAEQLFLGCTTRELALHFAERHNLCEAYVDVIRWMDQPGDAIRHRELVAAVSLARVLCRQNRVGASGEPQLETTVPLEETAGWGVLRETVFPSFDLRKFEQKVNADCRGLKLELQGRQKTPAVA
jgi:HD-like signal output (HDOD) protein